MNRKKWMVGDGESLRVHPQLRTNGRGNKRKCRLSYKDVMGRWHWTEDRKVKNYYYYDRVSTRD